VGPTLKWIRFIVPPLGRRFYDCPLRGSA
jgi:hypothetical protein